MNKRQKQSVKKKPNKLYGQVLFWAVIPLFAIFIGRFFYVGITHHADGQNLSVRVREMYSNAIDIKAKRGNIYDATGQPIAENATTYTVYVVLSKKAQAYGKKQYLPQSQKHKAAQILGKNLGMEPKKVYRILNPKNSDLYQVEFGSAGRNISLATKEKIQSYHLSGVKFTPAQARMYPYGVFASHVIGIAQQKNGNLTGVMGIEKQYNEYLAGHNGVRKYAADRLGIKLPSSRMKYRKPVDGDDIYTTFNPKYENYLEETLTYAQKQYKPVEMAGVLIDPHTGEILAAAQRPTFNAQTKVGLDQIWRNSLTEEAYEPGSTMKTMLLAASIDSGHFQPNAYYQSGKLDVGGGLVTDWNQNGWGSIPYYEAYLKSSNVGMAHMEQQMGSNVWLKYIKRFGFLESTKSGLGIERPGSILFKLPIEQADTAFGQGIDVTSMQMVQAYTAIANDGKMVRPRFIKKIVNPNTGKTVYETKTKVVGRPITSKTASQVRYWMQQYIINSQAIGKPFKVNGFDTGIKDGQAQIARSDGKGYISGGPGDYIFDVAGIAPVNHPRFLVYIVVKQPQVLKKNAGDLTIADIYTHFMKKLLNSTQRTTIKNIGDSMSKVPDVKKWKINDAAQILNQKGFHPVQIGSGSRIVRQSDAGNSATSGTKVFLITNGEIKMPDVSGWSRNDVVKFANLVGINVQFKGSGFVTKQSIPKGSTLNKNKSLIVVLR
ncbi:penicillin-binding transpeptidase domain-containing protein [Ligilactobacillus sp. LYQ139]|uniref:penicillin-binding transpeptidase domain-containing protein n=1 Tax=Ligilactobacillus sp. LYQ139 TaxID=3378800 RepID=UPI003853472B